MVNEITASSAATGSKPLPLVFLPGLLCDERLWQGQVAVLSQTHAVTVADLTQDDSVAAMAARVLADAPPRFALAALSMGGYVAFEIWRQAPERVARLALFSTSAAPDSTERTRERRAAISSLASGRFMGVTNRMLPRLIHPRYVDTPLGDEVRAMATRVGSTAFLRQQQAILTRPDSRPTLATIHVPTLVAVGNEDVMTPPSHAEEIRQSVAGSVLHRFEHCGHLPPMESPVETTHLLLQWLSAAV